MKFKVLKKNETCSFLHHLTNQTFILPEPYRHSWNAWSLAAVAFGALKAPTNKSTVWSWGSVLSLEMAEPPPLTSSDIRPQFSHFGLPLHETHRREDLQLPSSSTGWSHILQSHYRLSEVRPRVRAPHVWHDGANASFLKSDLSKSVTWFSLTINFLNISSTGFHFHNMEEPKYF